MQQLSLDEAVHHLQSGQVLLYPTEAVWGLGCDPYQQQAFEKLLLLKKRPLEKGVILLSESIARIEPLLAPLEPQIRNKVIASWQHPVEKNRAITWLLPISSAIPPWIYGQHDRVAIRVTQHTLCQRLCAGFDSLIVSTSANPAGQDPATDLHQLEHYFAQHSFADLAILTGKIGQNRHASRIVDAVTGQVIRA